MIRLNKIFIINLLLLVTLWSCKNDPLDVNISDIDLDIRLERFDRELFELDFDSIDNAVSYFYRTYGDFFDVFNVHVINIGPASDKYYGSYLSMFVNDPQNHDVYEYTQNVFSDNSAIEKQLSEGFSRYHFHYPDSTVPRIVAYVSRFNHKLFTVDKYIGIGLDQYLGQDCEFYDMLRTPEYMQYNMHMEKIPSDVAMVWASSLYEFNDSVENVLNHMIYKGMLLYFSDVLFPNMEDALKIGFSPGQMQFCRNNEVQMWTFLVEHKLLFSTDPLDISKLTEPSPNSYYFPSEAPGRAAVWLGWQIVREYAKRNPHLSVAEIMAETDYQKILRESRYNP